jgi:chromosome segregation ATPase
MKVTALMIGVANLLLVGLLVYRMPGEAVTVSQDDRSATLVTSLDQMTAGNEKRTAAVAELQRDLGTARKELAELRAALVSMEEKASKSGDAVRVAVGQMANTMVALEKKLDRPDAAPKQMTELVAELKRMNEQFKRVIDFAAGRGFPDE